MIAADDADWWARGLAAGGLVLAYLNYRFTRRKEEQLEPAIKVQAAVTSEVSVKHSDNQSWTHTVVMTTVTNSGGSPLDVASFTIGTDSSDIVVSVKEWTDKGLVPLNQGRYRLEANGLIRIRIVLLLAHPTKSSTTIRVRVTEASGVQHWSEPLEVPIRTRPGLPAPLAG